MGLVRGRCCPSLDCLRSWHDCYNVVWVEPTAYTISGTDLYVPSRGCFEIDFSIIRKEEGLGNGLVCNKYSHHSLLMKPFGGAESVALTDSGIFVVVGLDVGTAGFCIRPRRALISTAGASLVARLVLAPPSRARRCLR